MNDNRIMLDKDFGKAAYVPKPARWVRTDWDQTVAIGIGICAMIWMVLCFYILFTIFLP